VKAVSALGYCKLATAVIATTPAAAFTTVRKMYYRINQC